MHRALLACLLAGCYHANSLNCAVSCASDQPCPSGLQCGLSDHLCHSGALECSEIDAGVPATDDAAPGSDASTADAPSAVFCDHSNATIIACYEFEGTTANSSAYALTITTGSVTFGTGKPGLGKALVLTTDTVVRIGASASLDLPHFTVEAWVYQTAITNNHNVTVVNNVGQYGMFVDVNNDPYCAYSVSGNPVPFPARASGHHLPTNVWTHLACVFDGDRLTLYVNGGSAAELAMTNTVATGVMQTTGIGSDALNSTAEAHFVGMIDNVRILSVPRPQALLCADAGQTGC